MPSAAQSVARAPNLLVRKPQPFGYDECADHDDDRLPHRGGSGDVRSLHVAHADDHTAHHHGDHHDHDGAEWIRRVARTTLRVVWKPHLDGAWKYVDNHDQRCSDDRCPEHDQHGCADHCYKRIRRVACAPRHHVRQSRPDSVAGHGNGCDSADAASCRARHHG